MLQVWCVVRQPSYECPTSYLYFRHYQNAVAVVKELTFSAVVRVRTHALHIMPVFVDEATTMFQDGDISPNQVMV